MLVLERTDETKALERVVDLVQEQGAARVVVGYPLSLTGHVGPQAEQVARFVHNLSQVLEVPVELWDERYSTVSAESILRERGMGSRKRRRWVDATAAAVILQDYLDARAWREVQGHQRVERRGGEKP